MPVDPEEGLPERARGLDGEPLYDRHPYGHRWWHEGQRVIVRDTGREDLNGRTGTIAYFDGQTGRFHVAIDNDSGGQNPPLVMDPPAKAAAPPEKGLGLRASHETAT